MTKPSSTFCQDTYSFNSEENYRRKTYINFFNPPLQINDKLKTARPSLFYETILNVQ